MSADSGFWGFTIEQSTINAVEAMKAAKLTPEQGAAILADVFANIIGQLDVGLAGFRKDVIVKLTLDEANTKRMIL